MVQNCHPLGFGRSWIHGVPRQFNLLVRNGGIIRREIRKMMGTILEWLNVGMKGFISPKVQGVTALHVMSLQLPFHEHYEIFGGLA